jgi:hypothetical protein
MTPLFLDIKQPAVFVSAIAFAPDYRQLFRRSFNNKNEGGAGRQRLAGLHGSVCEK